MASEGRRSSASSFAARLGLRPLSSITPADEPRASLLDGATSGAAGGPGGYTYGYGSNQSSPTGSRRSSHADAMAVSMNSIPQRNFGQYANPSAADGAQKRYRRPSSVGGEQPVSKPASQYDDSNHNGSRVHARKASTVERSATSVRRGSSAYGLGLTSGRLSVSAPQPPAGSMDDEEEAQAEDRQERLQENAAAFVLATKNLLGWETSDPQHNAGESELSRLLSLLLWDAGAIKDEVMNVQIEGSSMEKAQALIAFKEFCSEVLKFLSLIASNTTFQSMWSSISTELSPLWTAVDPSLSQTVPLPDILSALETTVLASPAYHFIFLQLLSSFCKLWSSAQVLRESFFVQVSENWDKFEHTKKLLEAIDATLTQLTGLPFPPFLRSLLYVFFDLNDVLDLFVGELEIFLAQPLPLSTPDVFERHPATGRPYSPGEATTRVSIVIHRFRSLLEHQPLAGALAKATARACKVWDGITGNSAVLRFYRASKRLFADILTFDRSNSVQLKANTDDIALVLRQIAQGLGQVSLQPISSKDDDVTVELKDVTFNATDVVPDHIAFNKSTDWTYGRSQGIQEHSKLLLEGIEIDAPSVAFSYTKGEGANASTDSGRADIHLAFDLRVLFSPTSGAWPAFDKAVVKIKACDVSMKGTGKDTLYQLAWPLVRNVMIGRIQAGIESFISSKLAFIFSKPAAEPVTPLTQVLKAQSKSAVATPATEHTETYLSARARFRREITGITGLQSGDLDNPLEDSVPSSPTMPTNQLKPRGGSMASYLSDVAAADATDPKNIQRPPKARGASSAFALDESDEDDDVQLRRAGRRYTNAPDAGMDMDAYENAAQNLDRDEQHKSRGGRRMTMSGSLSEVAARDTTSEANVKNPPRHEGNDEQPAYQTDHSNLSMDHVTRALSGLAERQQAPSTTNKQYRTSPMPMSPKPQGRRKSMSEWLNDKTTEDHTQLNKPGGDYNIPNKAGVPSTSGPTGIDQRQRRDSAMRNALTETSKADCTLDENIASPPGSNAASRAASFVGGSRPSFTGLKKRFSMAESLDHDMEHDETIPGRSNAPERRKSSVNEPIGLSSQEMRKRSQSFKLDENATRDGTLPENVASPPQADQKPLPEDDKPNPLARRPSTVQRM